jgi:uroporphyrinogen-III synthase
MRLLVTRPEPDNARTAAALRSRGHEVTLAPVLRVEPEPDAELGGGPWAAVLITSANAARAVVAHPRRDELLGIPAFAVGRRSAEAARQAGFAEVISADGNADDLARLVAARAASGKPNHPLLWLAGEDRAGDLVAALAAHDIAVHTVVVYRAVAETTLPDEVRDALGSGRVDGVLHYSRRSADAFEAIAMASGIDLKSLPTKHYCLSAQVAEPLRQIGVGTVVVAARPDEAALLALLD